MPCLVPTSLTDSLTFLKHIADVIPAQYYVVDDANTMLIGQFQAEDVWSVKAGDRVCNSRGCWAVGELVIEMVVNE